MSAAEHPDAAIGWYVLGLDDATGRRQWREHLATCVVCRHEWEQLRELPPLLARADELQPPSNDLEGRLVAAVVGVRRHGHHG